jgi:histidinol-phosphate aminotransferase
VTPGRAPESFVRATIRPLAAYGPPRDPARVALHLNESPSELPDDLKDRLTKEIRALDWSKYPITDGASLARDVAEASGAPVESVLVGNGSNELLQLLLFACVEPGDEVVVASPSFALYALQAKALGANVIEVPLRSGSEYRFPIDELIKASKSAKLVMLGSPNNPTGTTLTPEQVGELATRVPCLLGIDEAYRDFCGQDFLPLLNVHPRVAIFRTFSKAFAMAGLRAGWMIGWPPFCAELRKIQLPYNLSAITALVARELIKRPDLVAQRAALVREERERVAQAMRALGITVHPSGANFLLFEQPRKDLHAGLFRRGVLIRSYPFGLRVSIGAPAHNDAFLAALRAELG